MNRVVLLLFSILFFAASLNAQESGSIIEVVGKSVIKEIPEDVLFRIPLNIVDSTYLGCSERLSFILNEFQENLKSKGIEKESINTSNYSIAENIVFEEGKRVQLGYKGNVNIMLNAKFAPELISKVLQSLNNYQLNYSISFLMSASQKERLTNIAMVNAVDDATQKARILAEGTGVELGEIERISYGIENYRADPMANETTLMRHEDSQLKNDLNLSPPLTSFVKSVLVVWKIK
jgi:uncharacterized protein YggE